jgi:hypothetical protein
MKSSIAEEYRILNELIQKTEREIRKNPKDRIYLIAELEALEKDLAELLQGNLSELMPEEKISNPKDMNQKFETMYDERVKLIKDLQEKLKSNPENQLLKSRIKEEEDTLFAYVIESGRTLERYRMNFPDNFDRHDDAA